MKEEILLKILEVPLSAWTGHYKLELDGVIINLVRGNPGGCPCFYLDIEGVLINDKRLSNLYYSLYEHDQKIIDEEPLKSIYDKLCKIHK